MEKPRRVRGERSEEAKKRRRPGVERKREERRPKKGLWTRYRRAGRNGEAVTKTHERREKYRGTRGQKEEEKRGRWKEERVRVGTGYRVRSREGKGKEGARVFDLGYCDLKVRQRKRGVVAKVNDAGTARTREAEGAEARRRVMNTVVEIEKRRPLSAYTGAGVARKSKVGKKKLKSTKRGKT
jgi:hypothetical protein